MTITEPLNTRDLAAFVAAVETGSIQSAADSLALTQSAATKRIQSLESRLDTSLLDRGRYGVSPTEVGRTLYPDAKEALDVLRRAEVRITAAGMRQARVLRIAASHTIGGFLLPGWLSRFRANAPDVQPQVEVVNSQTVLERVRGGDADIGFVEGGDDLGRLEQLTVGLDELVVVVSARHRWKRRTSIRARELAEEPFYAREHGSGTRTVADQALEQLGQLITPSLEMTSTQSLKRAVADGGFSVLSRHAIVDEVAAGSLVALTIKDADMHRTLRAVRRPLKRQPAAAADMWRWLGPTDRATLRQNKTN